MYIHIRKIQFIQENNHLPKHTSIKTQYSELQTRVAKKTYDFSSNN